MAASCYHGCLLGGRHTNAVGSTTGQTDNADSEDQRDSAAHLYHRRGNCSNRKDSPRRSPGLSPPFESIPRSGNKLVPPQISRPRAEGYGQRVRFFGAPKNQMTQRVRVFGVVAKTEESNTAKGSSFRGPEESNNAKGSSFRCFRQHREVK